MDDNVDGIPRALFDKFKSEGVDRVRQKLATGLDGNAGKKKKYAAQYVADREREQKARERQEDLTITRLALPKEKWYETPPGIIGLGIFVGIVLLGIAVVFGIPD